MVFGKSKLELKVGFFVFIGLIILGVFVLHIGNLKVWTAAFRLNFVFNFANGVKIGAPVRFAGVDVGEVKEVNLIFVPREQKTKVQIVGWLKPGIKIPSDSTVWVNTLGILGEKYVEIMPGKDYLNCLVTEQTLIGTDPVPMHEIGELLKNMAEHIDESIVGIKNKEGTIGKLLYDDRIYNELEALISDVRRNPWKLFWKTREKK